MEITRRDAVIGASALFGVALTGADASPFTPEQFGARGDGVANDGEAFRRLAAAVTARGGGTIVLRPVTYLVGAQVRTGAAEGYAWDPPPLLELTGLSGPIVIEGRGATIRCRPGLRFGTFDPVTGRATKHPQPFYGGNEIASPYRWMIRISRCTGRIEIRNLNLDGNLDGLVIGGGWGDTGHQLPATGIGLYDNSGPEILTNVASFDHALDGIIIDGIPRGRRAPSVLTDVRCHGNGRQGVSIVGGHGYRFVRCAFERTGTGKLMSAPGAGVDLEAEGGKTVRDIRFDRCRFAHNTGVGLLAAEGDVADVTASDCRFIATRSWGTWPNKPRMRFERCTFAGAIVNAYGSANPAIATQFVACRFLDDPAAAGAQRVYGGDNATRPIAILPYSDNTRFSECVFLLTHDCVLPWSTKAIYANCSMTQTSRATSYPRGTYAGTNRIVGQADLNYSRVEGSLSLNGRLLRQADVAG